MDTYMLSVGVSEMLSNVQIVEQIRTRYKILITSTKLLYICTNACFIDLLLSLVEKYNPLIINEITRGVDTSRIPNGTSSVSTLLVPSVVSDFGGFMAISPFTYTFTVPAKPLWYMPGGQMVT